MISKMLNAALNYLLIPPWGTIGAAVATALACLAGLTLSLSYISLKHGKVISPSSLETPAVDSNIIAEFELGKLARKQGYWDQAYEHFSTAYNTLSEYIGDELTDVFSLGIQGNLIVHPPVG